MNLRNILVILIIVICLGFFIWYMYNGKKETSMENTKVEGEMTYIPIGDSYTIGNGVLESERWPNILVSHLKSEGININLLANPAVSGYRVKDAIEDELPVIEKLKPDFVTVFIGTNDNFNEGSVEEYKKDYQELLDKLQPMLKNSENIVLITIPDYPKSPQGREFNLGHLSKLVEEYNKVIKDEAEKRNLKVADIFPLSQTMTEALDYTPDGLHLSGEGYAKWESVIFPVVKDLLK